MKSYKVLVNKSTDDNYTKHLAKFNIDLDRLMVSKVIDEAMFQHHKETVENDTFDAIHWNTVRDNPERRKEFTIVDTQVDNFTTIYTIEHKEHGKI
mgnify:CR=1 FL=1